MLIWAGVARAVGVEAAAGCAVAAAGAGVKVTGGGWMGSAAARAQK